MASDDQRILIFVVTYNAAQHITDTLDRIPRQWLDESNYHILIVDDDSKDNTSTICHNYASTNDDLSIEVIINNSNLGYGGNQKKGYKYAIRHGYDVVVLLHGDGQYAPSHLPVMVAPLLDGTAQVVLGSRMLNKADALKGQMPLYKWLGNQVLTGIQNTLLNTKLAEFHTGYRAYDVQELSRIHLSANSDYFDFDTEILIQLIDRKMTIKEIPIPTFYGDEISYVNGFKYAALIIWATIKSRLVRRGWMKDARFNL